MLSAQDARSATSISAKMQSKIILVLFILLSSKNEFDNLCQLYISKLTWDYLIIAKSVRVNEGLSDGYFSDGLVTVSFAVYFPYSSSFVIKR